MRLPKLKAGNYLKNAKINNARGALKASLAQLKILILNKNEKNN